MDRCDQEILELRQKAEDFLYSFLQNSRSCSEKETARNLTNLAFDEQNPVRNFFSAAATSGPQQVRAPSPAETVRPHSSHRAFSWLGRARADHSTDRIAATVLSTTTAQHGMPMAKYQGALGIPNESSPSSSRKGSIPPPSRSTPSTSSSKGSASDQSSKSMRNYFSTSHKTARPSGMPPYNCILCNCDLSSKGVCKRHLEDQHVLLRQYECEKCRKAFDTKADAKKHCGTCGAGVFYFTTVKPQAKKLYACEFTGERFLSLKTYIDHLVQLCEKRDGRPNPSMHRKLRALLDQPGCRKILRELSEQSYGSPDGWRAVLWQESTVMNKTRDLEHATVQDDDTIIFESQTGQRSTQQLRAWLTELLRSGQKMPRPSPATRENSSSGSYQSSGISDAAPALASLSTAPVQSNGSSPKTPTPTAPQPRVALPRQNSDDGRSVTSSLHSAPMVDPMSGVIRYEHSMKRPLSEQSRMYFPDRQPPGPPIPNPDISYPISATTSHFTDQSAQMQDVPQVSLPYRFHDGTGSQLHLDAAATATANDNLRIDFGTDTTMTDHHRVLPDSASETTTIAQSYHEPELVNQMSYPTYWNPANQLAFSDQASFGFPGADMYDFNPQNFFPTGQASSSRTSSIVTGHTFVGSASMEDQKIPSFDMSGLAPTEMVAHPFFMGGNERPHPNAN